jgi:hypothetical protein
MNQDFRAFFALLNARNVEFLLIGGVAYNYHAPPRATRDIDIWVRPERGNVERLIQAIDEFGFPIAGLDTDDLTTSPRVLMLGRVPNRIDILTRPDGPTWEEAWPRRVEASYGDVRIRVISCQDLIAAKRSVGRPRDLADAATLEEVERRRQQRGE